MHLRSIYMMWSGIFKTILVPSYEPGWKCQPNKVWFVIRVNNNCQFYVKHKVGWIWPTPTCRDPKLWATPKTFGFGPIASSVRPGPSTDKTLYPKDQWFDFLRYSPSMVRGYMVKMLLIGICSYKVRIPCSADFHFCISLKNGFYVFH